MKTFKSTTLNKKVLKWQICDHLVQPLFEQLVLGLCGLGK